MGYLNSHFTRNIYGLTLPDIKACFEIPCRDWIPQNTDISERLNDFDKGPHPCVQRYEAVSVQIMILKF